MAEHEHVPPEELETLEGQPLPDREAMSIVHPGPEPPVWIDPVDDGASIMPVPPDSA